METNINYFKSIYHVCRSHTGYNSGHDYNVTGFERLQEALDFISNTASEGVLTDIFVKVFGGKGCAPCDNKIYKLFSNVENMNKNERH